MGRGRRGERVWLEGVEHVDGLLKVLGGEHLGGKLEPGIPGGRGRGRGRGRRRGRGELGGKRGRGEGGLFTADGGSKGAGGLNVDNGQVLHGHGVIKLASVVRVGPEAVVVGGRGGAVVWIEHLRKGDLAVRRNGVLGMGIGGMKVSVPECTMRGLGIGRWSTAVVVWWRVCERIGVGGEELGLLKCEGVLWGELGWGAEGGGAEGVGGGRRRRSRGWQLNGDAVLWELGEEGDMLTVTAKTT